MITEQDAVKKILKLPGVAGDPITKARVKEIIAEAVGSADYRDLQEYDSLDPKIANAAARRLDHRAMINGQITREDFETRHPRPERSGS